MSELIQRQAQSMGLQDKLIYAEKLAASGLIPQAYQRNPPNVLVAVEKGEALGLHPMVALEEINVIHGRTSMSATLMMSLARAAGHTVRASGDAQAATCTIKRKDDPDFEHKVTWDQAKAQQNQLWGKGHWQKNPELMLKYRAISECVRMACPEVLAGVKYTPEEVVEITSHEYTESTPSGPAAPKEQVPAQEPPVVPETKGPDQIDQRIQQVWDDPAQIQTLGKWLRSSNPRDPRLEKLINRHRELTEQAQEPSPAAQPDEDGVIDAEVVPENEAAQQSEPLFEETAS